MPGLQETELLLLALLLVIAGLAALAKRLKTPYPIVLVIAGLLLSFVPGIPNVPLKPEAIFLVVLPPLLFSAAFLTSWRDFRYNLASILLLAFGLVGFTVYGVALVSRWVLPGFDWRTGLVLGAVVCTTDAIAVTSIAERLGLPRRIAVVIEGESLVNDASGLLAFEFTVSLMVTGRRPDASQDIERLIYLIAGSIVVGLVVAKLTYWLEKKVDDAPIEITLTLLAAYFAYLAGESAHVSGVLSTVVCGLYLGHQSSLYFSTGARVRSVAVWDTLTFLFNGFVFMRIGLELRYILPKMQGESLVKIILLGLLLSGVVIALRIVWVFPGAWASYAIRRKFLHQKENAPSPGGIFVVGWAGMRGVVALAAAISLPQFLDDGRPFPHRSEILFLTFCVIFVTLVLQGLTLPWVILKTGLAGLLGLRDEEILARQELARAAASYLENAQEHDQKEFAPIYDELLRRQQIRMQALEKDPNAKRFRVADMRRYDELVQRVTAIQRAALLHLRNENKINDEVMRRLESELDFSEIQRSQWPIRGEEQS
ncbi:MAG TPA: Na+/H+ antiporter [Verrucomicrobiae bacterium]|nr:Na+/H+ antiporter [Verrucomicrobiae bacterium]